MVCANRIEKIKPANSIFGHRIVWHISLKGTGLMLFHSWEKKYGKWRKCEKAENVKTFSFAQFDENDRHISISATVLIAASLSLIFVNKKGYQRQINQHSHQPFFPLCIMMLDICISSFCLNGWKYTINSLNILLNIFHYATLYCQRFYLDSWFFSLLLVRGLSSTKVIIIIHHSIAYSICLHKIKQIFL